MKYSFVLSRAMRWKGYLFVLGRDEEALARPAFEDFAQVTCVSLSDTPPQCLGSLHSHSH